MGQREPRAWWRSGSSRSVGVLVSGLTAELLVQVEKQMVRSLRDTIGHVPWNKGDSRVVFDYLRPIFKVCFEKI